MTLIEAAQYADVSAITMRRWLLSGKLRGGKALHCGRVSWNISRRDVDRWMREGGYPLAEKGSAVVALTAQAKPEPMGDDQEVWRRRLMDAERRVGELETQLQVLRRENDHLRQRSEDQHWSTRLRRTLGKSD